MVSTSTTVAAEGPASPALVSALFLLRDALSFNIRRIFPLGMAPSSAIHDPTTVAARVDVSDKE